MTTVTYNPFEPGFTDDPYPAYATLREHGPVHESPLGFWMLFAHDDVLRFLRDPALSVEANRMPDTMLDQMVREIVGDRLERGSQSMLSRDPPDHTRLRRLVSKAFTPRMIERLRPRIEQLVTETLDRADDRGSIELVGDLAFPLPFVVITELLGMPEADTDDLRTWSGHIVRTLEPVNDPDVLRQIVDAIDNMRALVSDAIAWKRREPADDMLSALVAAEEHGDVLSDEELLEQVMLLYIAGHETTVNLIGNGSLALLRHPAEAERLRADPSLDGNAIDELLRYDSPVQMSRRVTVGDVEVAGHTIPAQRFVALSLASANRDAGRFGPTADEVDLSREDAHAHVAFGGGAHHCLGAALARLEGQVAIGRLFRRFPSLALAGEPEWNGRINLRGLERLPLSVR